MIRGARRPIPSIALVATLAVFGVLASLSRSDAAVPSDGYVAFQDPSAGTSFAVSIGATSLYVGHFEFAVAGLGLVWPDAPAVVTANSDHSVVVTYAGGGQLDRQATLDPTFGFHRVSGTSEEHPIRLQSQINPDRITATATLWVDGVQYHLVDRMPTPDADTDLAAIAGALRSEDWGGLYDRSYSGLTGQLSRSVFVATLASAFAPYGHVTAVVITAQPIYGDSSGGFDTASAKLAVTLSNGASSHTYDANVSLLWESSTWKILSLPLVGNP